MQLLCSSLQGAAKGADLELCKEFADRLEIEFDVVKKTLEEFAGNSPVPDEELAAE
jgi:hypothetical protein